MANQGVPLTFKDLPDIPAFGATTHGAADVSDRSVRRLGDIGVVGLQGRSGSLGGMQRTPPTKGKIKDSERTQFDKREPPPEVSNSFRKVKTREILLRNAVRRSLRKKMQVDPGIWEPISGRIPEFVPTTKGRCKRCPPCLRRTCGVCGDCTATKKRMCLNERWCEAWPRAGENPQLSRCSNISSNSPEGLRRAGEELGRLCTEFKEAHAELGAVLEASNQEVWSRLPELSEEHLREMHDKWLDEAEAAIVDAQRSSEVMDRILEVQSEVGQQSRYRIWR